jgi:hypothetical protein
MAGKHESIVLGIGRIQVKGNVKRSLTVPGNIVPVTFAVVVMDLSVSRATVPSERHRRSSSRRSIPQNLTVPTGEVTIVIGRA